ncbi:MAG TPA: methylmalonyl-CoA epimerase [Actinomycetota bacterium]|nr:methylmalonyl-CoA epimerase [Actinomycetota bacterium]
MALLALDHVAVAVTNLDEALAHYRDVWELEPAHVERVADQGVDEAMLELPGSSLQLIAPISPESMVASFLDKRGPGLHHVAYAVADLDATLAHLRERGVALIDEHPRVGGGGARIAFVHPRANGGLLVELVERR